MKVSYLTDALKDLLGALIDVTSGAEEARFYWWDEPGEYRWILRRSGDGVAVTILEFPDWWDDSGNPFPDEEGRLVFRSSVPLDVIVNKVALEAQRLLGEHGEHGEHGEDGYRTLWIEHPFPTAQLSRLLENR